MSSEKKYQKIFRAPMSEWCRPPDCNGQGFANSTPSHALGSPCTRANLSPVGHSRVYPFLAYCDIVINSTAPRNTVRLSPSRYGYSVLRPPATRPMSFTRELIQATQGIRFT